MTIIRFFLPIVALFFTLTLYWMLNQTIIISNNKSTQTKYGNISFIRMINESKIEKKHRVKKKLPKPKKIKTPPKITTNINKVNFAMQKTKLNINISPIKLSMNINNNGFLNGAIFTKSDITQNTSAMPILRIPPMYPRRAKILKKEGYVKVQLLIGKDGLVKNAIILDSNPKNIFDDAALQSVYGWKFKPKQVNGQRIEQMAEQILEFKLR
ncbi:energy transducer TonB [Sulfurimonas sp.]|uniref:energy transducer TonB n=2 Tax=Sulfurimonas sp. TaxID=2022749 RepID=UPI002B489CD7|nr:energy transducer TonB [Sulfurimonas sp.]